MVRARTSGPAGTGRRPRAPGANGSGRPPAAAVALAVAAAGCAGWFGWSWYGAAHDDSLHFSRTRDEVLRVGEQAVRNLNTLDYRDVDRGLDLWLDSCAGELHQQIAQGREQFQRQVRQARTISTAQVLEGAVTELDVRAGKASVIVAVRITVIPAKGEPTTKQSRLKGQLTRIASRWRLTALGQPPISMPPAQDAPTPGR